MHSKVIILVIICLTISLGYADKEECGPNQTYDARKCQPTCLNVTETCPFLGKQCSDNKYGCYCKSGYALDKTNTCVPISTCADRQEGICGVDEVNECDNSCQRECVIGTCPQYFACMWGCYCKQGYKRQQNGKCVAEDKCKRFKVSAYGQ